jgi:Transglycosylase
VGFAELLSLTSDWMCGGLVARAATKYSRVLRTPDHFVEMLLLVEDKRFPIHFGIDPIAIIRAIGSNLRKGSLQGGSTVTQQIVTIRMTSSGAIRRSLIYKLAQIAGALCESATNSKASILEEYIETVYWGRAYRGLDSAVQGYFKQSRGSLSVAQSFFLAERIAAPNRMSTQRIGNLIKRPAIKAAIARNGTTLSEILKVYEQVCPYRDDGQQLLHGRFKRLPAHTKQTIDASPREIPARVGHSKPEIWPLPTPDPET